MKKPSIVGSFSGKTFACILVLACVAIGVVGLILPIIPGLVFLAIAALIAARHFPSVDARLRKHRATAEHMDKANGFFDLSLDRKIRLAGWLCVKMLLDGLAMVSSLIGSVIAKRGGVAGGGPR